MNTIEPTALNPQQQLFLAYYIDPKSETFGNALQSALRANYSQEYAESITNQMPNWLSENLGKRSRLLMKAEKVLEKTLDSEKDMKLAQDTAKFIAKTVGKQEYSERQEITGADGAPLILPSQLITKNELSPDTSADTNRGG